MKRITEKPGWLVVDERMKDGLDLNERYTPAFYRQAAQYARKFMEDLERGCHSVEEKDFLSRITNYYTRLALPYCLKMEEMFEGLEGHDEHDAN